MQPESAVTRFDSTRNRRGGGGRCDPRASEYQYSPDSRPVHGTEERGGQSIAIVLSYNPGINHFQPWQVQPRGDDG